MLEALTRLDHALFRLCYVEHPSGALFVLMVAATTLGSGWSMLAAFPLLIPRRTRRFALELLLTLSSAGILVFVLKMLVGRDRPAFELEGVRALFGNPTDHSFPSGHAAGCFAFAGFVVSICLGTARARPERARYMWAVAALVLVLAATIAYSRVFLGCHFPLDVGAGALLGGTLGIVGARRYVKGAEAVVAGPPLAPLPEADPK